MFWWDESLSTPAWVEIKTREGCGRLQRLRDRHALGMTQGNTGTTTAGKIPKGDKGDPGKDGTAPPPEVKGGAGIASDGSTSQGAVDLATNPGLRGTCWNWWQAHRSRLIDGITVDNNGVSVTTPCQVSQQAITATIYARKTGPPSPGRKTSKAVAR